jgi:acetyltransferase
MRTRISAARPDAHLQGFSVEPMVRRPGAYELILGMSCDAQFGPVLVFGHGGTAVEAIDDRALALPPLNLHLAEEMISRTRIARLLAGARGLPAANIEALAIALVNLSQLVCDIAEIAELDINPLLADEYGVIALDARFRVAATTQKPAERLAIRPYPRELEEELSMPDGAKLLLRPIRPEDEPSLQRGFAALNPEEIYMRFFTPLKTLTHAMAARFSQLDYDREMALVLTTPGPPGEADFLGSVRIVCDPDMQRAEFAIIIRHDMTGKGLGVLLMRRIMAYCRSRGIAEIFGEVLSENLNMLNLCRFLGFTIESKGKEPAVVTVRLRLDQEAGQHDDASRSPS